MHNNIDPDPNYDCYEMPSPRDYPAPRDARQDRRLGLAYILLGVAVFLAMVAGYMGLALMVSPR